MKLIFKSIFFNKMFPVIVSIAFLAGGCTFCGYEPQAIPPQPTATPTCNLTITSPKGPYLPETGPLEIHWTKAPNASIYLLFVDNGNFQTTKTSYTVYMENFAVGTVSILVQARDADANILCEAKVEFTKDQPKKTKKEKDGGGQPLIPIPLQIPK